MTKSVSVFLVSLLMVSSQLFAQVPPPTDHIIDMVNYEDYKGAAAAINEKLSANPEDPTALYEKGYLLLAEERYEEAKTTFQKGIKSAKKYPYNHVGLARAYHKLGMTEDRDNSMAQAIKVNKGNDVHVMLAMAHAYTNNEQMRESKLTLYKARETDPEEGRVYEELGDYYYALRVYESAQENYEKAIDLDPTLIEPYFRLGKIAIINRDFPTGAEYLNKAIELDPDLSAAYRERGELWLKAGSAASDAATKQKYFGFARDDYQKYLELEKNDKRAQLRYASFLYLTGQYDECLAKLESVDTVTIVSQRLRGYCAMEQGNLKKAQEEMEKYFDMAPPEKVLAEDYQTMANIFVKEGNDEEAVTYLDKMVAKAAEKGNENLNDMATQLEQMINQFKKAKDPARELFYWEKLVDARSAVSTKDYYGMGTAARKAGLKFKGAKDTENALASFVKAKFAFGEVANLTPDYAPAQFWLGFSKDQIGEMDSTSEEAAMPWASVVEYDKVWELLKEKPVSEMSGANKYYIGNVALYLSFAKFIPNRDDNYDCEAAMPYIEKVKELDPNAMEKASGASLKDILETCEAGGK